YNGTVLSDGSVLGSILNVNGSMYDCGGIADDDSDIGFHVVGQSCTSYESLYCQSNNSWNSDFSGEWACDCTMGSSPSYWNLGGETASTTCCEIDGGNRATRISDSTMDNEYVTSSSDDACCSHITDCVNGSDCYASPDISTDIDVDGDFDYCNSGIWYDCNTDSECKTGDPCINNECIEINEFIEISNIGQTGFDQVNPEYTSIRSVILHLNYSSFVNKCRFINYDNPYVLPVTDNENWTGWENCVSTKFWQLSERSGLKTVYYQLNYTNGIGPSDMKNDSINYNFSGAGLDLSTPSNVEIDFGGYTNINTTLSASWSKATDFESDILRILILYNYSIFQNNDLIFSDIIDDLSFRKSGFNFSHEDNITINITTINSAGIQNNTKSNNLVIDLEPPGAVSIVSKLFKNRSTNTWQSLDESVWTNAKQVKFIWSATDDLSGIGAYSYLLTDVSTKYPDDIPEGSVGLFAVANEITLNLNSGQKYFRVKARDVAGSWGPNAISGESIFKIDNTHPSRPLLTNQEYNPDDQSVIYTWSESIDEESDISLYQINLTDNNDNLLDTFFVDGSETSGKYNSTFDQEIIIIIGAKNGAGLWRWSNQEDIDIDTEPPKILSTSEGTVIESTFLLYLNTNEDTTCYYTESGRTNKFLYTNTTYHEAKVTYSDGNYNFLVECLDNTLNSNTTTFVVKVNTDEEVTEVNIPSSFTSYVNTLTFFTLNVTNSTTRLGGISRESFNVVLDENNIDFKIDEIESGLYSIGIEGVENGTYSLKVNVNGIESNIMDLGIEDLYFNIIYSDNRLGNILNTDKISYGEIYNLDAGIASASETFIRDSQGSLFDVTVDYDNYAHIFLTYEIIGIGSKNKILKKDDFLNKQNPSFGYSINDYFVINLILDYYDLDITTDAERELKGKNNLFIKKIRSSSGKRTVYLSNDLE
ncbi:hypothetical protein HOD20_08330, partial [archaeon]|nr:hypothetical protein [archaeon]